MFKLRKDAKVVLCNKPIDLRKGFDTLTSIGKTELGLDLVPNLYILFSNLRRNRIKILYLDEKSISILSMRLEKTLDFRFRDVMIFNRKSFARFLNKTISVEPLIKYKIMKN
jgi:hypothetical protein